MGETLDCFCKGVTPDPLLSHLGTVVCHSQRQGFDSI